MNHSISQEWNGSIGETSAGRAGYSNGTNNDASAMAPSNNSHRPKQPTTDFEGTIERLLSQVEPRDSQLFKPNELQSLTQLCAIQSNMQESKHFSINNDLGFSDVQVDATTQLVSILEDHVKAATATNVIQQTYQASMSIKNATQAAKANGDNTNAARLAANGGIISIDQWIQYQGKESVAILQQGLEAASILLFIMASPGMDRRVVSEDAIASTISLLRHHLSKNILPAINQVGHLVAAMDANSANSKKSTTTTTTTTTSPNPKKRRRSSGAHNAAAATSGGGAGAKDMKKVYPWILRTASATILLLENLDSLVQKIPLDDQELLLITSGSMMTLELDPLVHQTQLVHQLHVVTNNLVTSIFRRYPQLRHVILEDLFPLMPKMPSSKRSMRTYSIQQQASSILYPSGLVQLSQSMAPSNTEPLYIQTISVLIMSLVQSAVRRPSKKSAEESSGGDKNNATANANANANADDDEEDASKTNPLQSGLRHCQAISDFFVQHLMQRCAKKGEDGGASEFRPILANLIDDLLLVVLIPEYPAAEMILLSVANRISNDLLQVASSSKSSMSSETTYLNTIFDAFGKICAAEAKVLKFARERPVHMRHPIRNEGDKHVAFYFADNSFSKDKLMINCSRCHTWYHGSCVGLSRDNMPDQWICDACQLARIGELEKDRNTNLGDMGCSISLMDETYCMQRLLIDYLSIIARKNGERGIQDAYGFQLARWIVELNGRNGSKNSPSKRSRNGNVQYIVDYENESEPNLEPLLVRLLELWDPSESSKLNPAAGTKSLSGMLHCISDEGRSRMMVHLICNQSMLLMSFRRQIDLIVKLMANENSALLRKLSLKAIERVTDSDQQLMIYSFMKKAVTLRFSDDSISVREAAVSLVGSYVVHSPEVATSFHAAFMMGLSDSGLSVRKRTIKILETILCSNPKYKGRAEACSVMLRLAADPKEDDGVRDLIHAVFLKVWLDKGDESMPVFNPTSPITPEAQSPIPAAYTGRGSFVEGLEERPVGHNGLSTPNAASKGDLLSPLPTRETRSTERRTKKRRLQIRSEIAAEQMVEVVKAADTGEHLTSLFRELLHASADADTERKSSQKRKQLSIAQEHCSMLVDALLEILLSFEENRESVTQPGKELVAIMRLIKVFTDVWPYALVKHLDTLLPYMKADNGVGMQDEAVVVSSLADIISQVSSILQQEDIEHLESTSLASDLGNVTYKLGRIGLTSATRTLCVLAHHKYAGEESKFRKKMLSIANVFYGVLQKHKDVNDFSQHGRKARANIQRALSVLGSVCRYHEVALKDDEMDVDNAEDENDESETQVAAKPLTWENTTIQCRKLFEVYMKKDHVQTKCVALRAMCGIFMAHPRELFRMNQEGLIGEVMSEASPASIQLEALRCWREILLAEESRIDSGEAKAKMDSKTSITVSNKISGDQDADATLFGGVLTSHASRLFQMTQSKDRTLRFAALDLVGHLLRQGQVNPMETVPFLLALQGDVEEDGIRSLALKLLMTEGEKRTDMLRQRVCAGVKQAYLFQKSAYPDLEEVSALVRVNRHGTRMTECVFSRVFEECIRSIKKQRHGLFRNLLTLFDIKSRMDSEEMTPRKKKKKESEETTNEDTSFLKDLPMLCFTSQVLAHLPYSVASDPLYIIHVITASLALRAPDLLDRLASFLRPYGLSSSDVMDETNAEADVLEKAAKEKSPSQAIEVTKLLKSNFDQETFTELCAEAGALSLMLRLKAFLRKAYNLSEARCIAYSPDEKDRVAERAITKASTMQFQSSLPMLAHQNDEELDNMIFQYAEFRQLMRAETSMETKLELEDDSDGDDIAVTAVTAVTAATAATAVTAVTTGESNGSKRKRNSVS
ncbi:unnamed protein product [Cylindrotheca closterium]|uniref:Sister chromatid cohesion protein n=1 Tax=Cylindrotheca closterium TaxID=2856 RepID=A0AAD2JGY5_9STRA|nr:unnamed protein product [Cylindrotheca closterium]